jgi:23S rRNA pseudouridine1911/1915/1917 synthase
LVLLNGKPAKKNDRLKVGDSVSVLQEELEKVVRPPLVAQEIPIDVIYEDDYLLAVNKPAGLVVHPGSGNRDGTLVNALLHRAGALSDGGAVDRPGIVHRLDKDTSGIVLVAKDNRTHEKLSAMFAERSVEKHYLGLCIGKRPAARGVIDAAIGRSRSDPTKRRIDREGKRAITEYRVLGYECGISVVHFRPKTGRTHQIRVHCSHAGFPIVADEAYGGGAGRITTLPVMARPFAHKIFACFERHALHAYRLRLAHPATGKDLDLSAPLPGDFQQALGEFSGKVKVTEF